MTTNYHTAITNGASNDPSTVNTPLSSLDTQLTANTSEITTARGVYTALGSRLDAIAAAEGSVFATLASGTATTSVTVGSGEADGFTVGAPVGYIVSGEIEYNEVAAASGTSITLDSAPSGTIASGSLIWQITPSEKDAGQAINSGNSVQQTLPNAMEWAGRNIYNVRAYGAVGDDATDDTAAIQAALDAASAGNERGTVYFPATSGRYVISDALIIPSYVVLQGDNNKEAGRSIIVLADDSHPAGMLVSKAWNDNNSAAGFPFAVRNLLLNGNRDNNGYATATLASNTSTVTVTVGAAEADAFVVGKQVAYTVSGSIEYNTVAAASGTTITLGTAPSGTISSGSEIFQRTHGIISFNFEFCVHDCRITLTSGDAIHMTDRNSAGTVSSSDIVYNMIIQNRISNCTGYGIWGGGTSSDSARVTDGRVTNNFVYSCQSGAIRLNKSTGWQVRGNHVWSIRDNAIWVREPRETSVVDNQVEGFGSSEAVTPGTYYGIRADNIQGTPNSGGAGCTIIGNRIRTTNTVAGNTYYSIMADGTTDPDPNVSIIGNVMKGNGAGNNYAFRLQQSNSGALWATVVGNTLDGNFESPRSMSSGVTCLYEGNLVAQSQAVERVARHEATYSHTKEITTGSAQDLCTIDLGAGTEPNFCGQIFTDVCVTRAGSSNRGYAARAAGFVTTWRHFGAQNGHTTTEVYKGSAASVDSGVYTISDIVMAASVTDGVITLRANVTEAGSAGDGNCEVNFMIRVVSYDVRRVSFATA